MNNIDLGRAFKAPFADPRWVNKTLMGFLWMLLVVTSPAVIGAMLDYIKGVSQGREDLPEWDNFGDKWVRGLLVSIAGFIYFLPIAVLGAVFIIPGVIASVTSGGDAAGGLLAGGMCLFWLIAVVYYVVVMVFFLAALTNYAMKGTFGSMFEFSVIMDKVRGGTGYWGAWLYAIIIGFGASVISSMLSATGVGAILYPAVAFLAYMIIGHLFGQWAQIAYGVTPMSAAYAPPAAPTYAPPAPPAAPAYQPPPAPAAPTYAPPAPPVAPPAPPVAPPAPPAAPPVAPPAPEPPSSPEQPTS